MLNVFIVVLSFLCFSSSYAMDTPIKNEDQRQIYPALFSQQLPRNAFDDLASKDWVAIELLDQTGHKRNVIFYQKGYVEGEDQANQILQKKFRQAGTAYSGYKQNLNLIKVVPNPNNGMLEIEYEFTVSNLCSWAYAETVHFTVVTKGEYINPVEDLSCSMLELFVRADSVIELPEYAALVPQILSRDAFDGFANNDSVTILVGPTKRPVVFYQKGYVEGNGRTNCELRTKFIKAGTAYSSYKQNLGLRGIRTSNGMLELDYEFIESTYLTKIIAPKIIRFTVITKIDDYLKSESMSGTKLGQSLIEQLSCSQIMPFSVDDLSRSQIMQPSAGDLSCSSLNPEWEIPSEIPIEEPALPISASEKRQQAMEAAYYRLAAEWEAINRMKRPTSPTEKLLRDRRLVEFGQNLRQAEAELNKEAGPMFSFWYAYIFGDLKQRPRQNMATQGHGGKPVTADYIRELQRPNEPEIEWLKKNNDETEDQWKKRKALRAAEIDAENKARMKARAKKIGDF